VATRVLAAESALTAHLAARDEVESATAADRVAEIDAEMREHAVATAKAAAVRDRRLPTLQKALDAVRVELYGPASAEGLAGSDGIERPDPTIAKTESIKPPGSLT
jgi:hypothetical protein